jgi:hypothetical protein
MRIWSGCNRRSTGFDGSLHSILWDRGRCRIHEMVANRWLRTETRLLLMAAWLAYASPTFAQLTGVEGRVPPPTEDDWNRVIGVYHLRVCQRGGMCADDSDRDVLLIYFVSIQRDEIPSGVVGDLRNAWTWHFWPPSTPEGFNACYVVARTIRQTHPMYSSSETLRSIWSTSSITRPRPADVGG